MSRAKEREDLVVWLGDAKKCLDKVAEASDAVDTDHDYTIVGYLSECCELARTFFSTKHSKLTSDQRELTFVCMRVLQLCMRVSDEIANNREPDAVSMQNMKKEIDDAKEVDESFELIREACGLMLQGLGECERSIAPEVDITARTMATKIANNLRVL